MIAKRAGLPTKILDAYSRFLENLVVYNSVAWSLGKKLTRRCGIPQGDPLSMMIVAMIMRPWLVRMEKEKPVCCASSMDVWAENDFQSVSSFDNFRLP